MNRFHIATILIFLLLSSVYIGLGLTYWLGAYIAFGILLLWMAGVLWLVCSSEKKKHSLVSILSYYLIFLGLGAAGLVLVLPEPKLEELNWWYGFALDAQGFVLLASFYGFWKAKEQTQWLPIFRASLWGIVILALQTGLFYAKQWDYDTELSLIYFGIVGFISLQKLMATWLARKQEVLVVYPTILDWAFTRFNPFSSFFDQLERFFGIDIKGTWAIQFVRASIEPLVVGMIIVGWFSSSFFVIHPNQSGIRENFGKPETEILTAGLHWKLPFPFGYIRVANTQEVQQLSIGHEEEPPMIGAEEEEKESILWANQHADEEFLLLLGDGHDVISADGVLQYKITDLHQYLYQTQNPETLLRTIAYRVLMQETVSRTLEEALSENLQVLAKRVNQRILEELQGKNIGIEPVLFSFSALHPPVAVAESYQEVISAQIDKDTKVLRAEAYRLQALPKAEKEALIAQNQAKEFWATKRAEAIGQAFQFEVLRENVRQNTPLYLFRKRQESLEKNLKGRELMIIDHRLEQAGAELWIQK